MAKRKWIVTAQLGLEHKETWEIDLVDDLGFSVRFVEGLSDAKGEQLAIGEGAKRAFAMVDVWARPTGEPEKHREIQDGGS